MAFKYDKPYRTLINIDQTKIAELFNLVYQMNTQEIIQYSLINKIPLGVTSFSGNNLIHEILLNDDTLKSEYNRLNVIKFLVQNEVNPDEPNKNNQTPIHIACQKQYKDICEYLIKECEVDLNYRDNNGFTPLHYLLIGEIKLFNKKDPTDIIAFQRKGDIAKKDDILIIKKDIYSLLRNNLFLTSLENTIYDTLLNNEEINKILLDTENKIQNRLASTDKTNLQKDTAEILALEKNDMIKVIEKLWGNFNNTPRLELHQPKEDSLVINRNNIGILKNINIKKELKTNIYENVELFNSYIENNIVNATDFDIADSMDLFVNIYRDFVNDSNHIITTPGVNGTSNVHTYNPASTFENDDYNTMERIYSSRISYLAKDNADNIIYGDSFVGGSRELVLLLTNPNPNKNNQLNTNINNKLDTIKTFFINENDIDMKFKKLFIALLLEININDPIYPIINGFINNNDIDNFLQISITLNPPNKDTYLYIQTYVHLLRDETKANEIYQGYTKLRCNPIYAGGIQTNLGGNYDIFIIHFMSCLFHKQYTFEEYIAHLTFVIFTRMYYQLGNITNINLLLQLMLLHFMYPLLPINNFISRGTTSFTQLPQSPFENLIKDTVELIHNYQPSNLDKIITNLYNLTSNNLIKVPNIMLCDFIYMIKDNNNFIIFNGITNGNFNFGSLENTLNNIAVSRGYNRLNLSQIHQRMFTLLLADLAPSLQNYIYVLIETYNLPPLPPSPRNFYFNKFIEAVNLKLRYKGTLEQLIDINSNFNIDLDLSNSEQLQLTPINIIPRFFRLDGPVPRLIQNIPLAFNYLYDRNPIDMTPLNKNFYVYNDYQYRPPTYLSHYNLLVKQYKEFIKLIKELLINNNYSYTKLFSYIKQGRIKDLSKYYLEFYFVISSLVNFSTNIILNLDHDYFKNNIPNINTVTPFDINQLSNFLNKNNGYVFLYYYLFGSNPSVKIPKFSYYKVESDKSYFLEDYSYELKLPDQPIQELNLRARAFKNKSDIVTPKNIKPNNFKSYLTNILFSNRVLENKIYFQNKNQELPPSVESVLSIYFEYNKINLFKEISKDANYNNILTSIDKLLSNLKIYTPNQDSHKMYYLFKLIEELIRDQTKLYSEKAINMLLYNNNIIPLQEQLYNINDFRNTSITIGDSKDDDFFKNYYLFLNNDVTETCDFIIYPNEYSNTYLLKQMYCLKIDQSLLKLLIDNNANPYVVDENNNSIISPIEKTYHYNTVETLLSNGVNLFKFGLPKNPLNNLTVENINHINKMIKGTTIDDNITNFISSQYNEIKVVLLANDRFGYNVINHLNTSFKAAFYIVNEYLTDNLWRFNKDYKFDDMINIFKITENNKQNINKNYLLIKSLNSGNIESSNQIIIYKDYLKKVKKIIQTYTNKLNNLIIERNELGKVNVNLFSINNKIITIQQSIAHITIVEAAINTRITNQRFGIVPFDKEETNIINTYNKIIKASDVGVYISCWTNLLTNELNESWNLDLIKILNRDKDLTNLNSIYDTQKDDVNDQYEIINIFYKQLHDLSKTYFEKSNYQNDNKILKFTYELLIHLTSTFICYNIEMTLRTLLLKYYNDVKPNELDFTDLNNKINYLFEASNVVTGKKFIEILYDDLPHDFVRNSIDIFKNQTDKNTFEPQSIRELLNNLFKLLTLNDIVSIPEDSSIMQILNRDLTDYFDLFIQKLINNWLVVIENVYKFTINQYRINNTIVKLIKK